MVNEVFAPFGMAALLSSQRDSSQLLKSPTERGPNGLDDATCTVSGRPIKSGLKPGRREAITLVGVNQHGIYGPDVGKQWYFKYSRIDKRRSCCPPSMEDDHARECDL
ncbi:hypothetical protein AAG906_031736 [Vitis piasezkii]